jgi:hypothetical protein
MKGNKTQTESWPRGARREQGLTSQASEFRRLTVKPGRRSRVGGSVLCVSVCGFVCSVRVNPALSKRRGLHAGEARDSGPSSRI